MGTKSAIVIGAGIVGLATARSLAVRGYSVKVFDRNEKAVGASIRNFGMVWPIGQPSGTLYQRAITSKRIWQEISATGAFWHDAVGSIHVAHRAEEWNVLQELYEIFRAERKVVLLDKEAVLSKSKITHSKGLLGGLYSDDEIIVDPRLAIGALPAYLSEKYGVSFYWNKCVSYISESTVYIGNEEEYSADIVFICSGADFETLYPEKFAAVPLTKCKLQMMRMEQEEWGKRIGPALCGGLSLIHYKSFQAAGSLAALKKIYEEEKADYLKWGIHVMVSQNEEGALTVGDSHEYGLTLDPFDRGFINQMIRDYLGQFATSNQWRLTESWNGTYAKMTDGSTETFFSPEPGVFVVNGLGGAGMTLSFGLAEEIIQKMR